MYVDHKVAGKCLSLHMDSSVCMRFGLCTRTTCVALQLLTISTSRSSALDGHLSTIAMRA